MSIYATIFNPKYEETGERNQRATRLVVVVEGRQNRSIEIDRRSNVSVGHDRRIFFPATDRILTKTRTRRVRVQRLSRFIEINKNEQE